MTEMTEIVDADIDRVDLVKGPANGLAFLLAKAAKKPRYKGLSQADKDTYVRQLADSSMNPTHDIASAIRRMSEYASSGNLPHGVTYSELKWMYDQAAKELHKRDPKSTAGGNFPALGSGVKKSADDLTKCQAMEAAFRAAGEEEDVKKATSGEDQAAEAVAGDDKPLPDADDLNADATADADGSGVPTDAPGDPDDPTAPAWEAVDAARARQAIQLAVALQRLLGVAQAREQQEASVGADCCDDENVFDLADACDALDCVIDILAPFAVNEQAEADQRAADVMTKAGRVLSGLNEQKIRAAMTTLQEVLASLPAPTDAPAGAAPKEPAVGETVTKAKGDPMVACYDQQGRLLGAVDAKDLTPLSAGTPVDDGDGDASDDADDAAPAADPADAADTPAAPTDDTATSTIPGTETVVSPADENVTKALKAEVTSVLTEALAPLAKQLGQTTELAEMVKSLKEQVEVLGRQPDTRKSPLLNGATGVAGIASRDGQVDELADLRKAVEDAPASKRDAARAALTYAEIKARFTR